MYVNVTKYAVTKDALGAIGIDAFLKDRVLVITATYDVIEGGWNLAACPEVVLTVVIPNVTSTTAGLGPLINVTLGYGVPRREPMWEPWLGKKMDHRGLIEFRSDPRLMLAGVHMTNHVPGGNITVSGVSTTHLAMQTVDGNLTVFGTDTSEIYMVAGSVHPHAGTFAICSRSKRWLIVAGRLKLFLWMQGRGAGGYHRRERGLQSWCETAASFTLKREWLA